LAPPPPEGIVVDDVYLVPPVPAVHDACVRAGARLAIGILCPGLAPAPTTSFANCGRPACVFLGALVLTFGLAGPPGYVGIPGQSGNHVFVLESVAGRESQIEFLRCTGGRRAGSTSLQGVTARWIHCPASGSTMNSGHVMLVWETAGSRYAVSLHSDTDVNRDLALAMAEHMSPVES
jgi:hypothetical protein